MSGAERISTDVKSDGLSLMATKVTARATNPMQMAPAIIAPTTSPQVARSSIRGSCAFMVHSSYAEVLAEAAPRMAKILERRKNLYFTGRSSLPERRVGATGSKAASATSSISQSHRAESDCRDRPFGCAITPPLDGNSAGAHPIAPGIEQAAARGGYPYHEGTAGRYPCPGDSARHDNARRIRSAPAAGSARPRGSP